MLRSATRNRRDESSGIPSLVLALTVLPGGQCAGRPCWSARGSRRLRYVDRGAEIDGVRRLVLKAGEAGHAAINLKAVGVHLPTLPAASGSQPFHQDTTVMVQLVNDAPPSGYCWSSELAAPAHVNDGGVFRDEAP